MIANILWLGMLLSGSFFTCSKFNRRFEEIFPITCMLTVFILFICGILGFLKYSVLLFLSVSVILYVYTIIRLLQKKANILSCFKNFFTPVFFLLCVYFLVLNIADFNLLASDSDEFSHWMDSIQVMTHLDDFITNPASNSLYRSYPPAMTLFQYLFQKIYLLCNPGNPFSEWRMYLAFQIFSLSMLFPFLKNLTFKKPFSLCLVGIIVFVFPLPFFPRFHYSIYIDSVVGILAGCGLAMPLLYTHKDLLYTLHVSLICATLVLLKDVGLYFACFVVILNAAVFMLHNRSVNSSVPKRRYTQLLYTLLPVLFVCLSKFGWKYVIYVNNSEISFGNKIDLLNYTRIFFLNNAGTYMQNIVSNFKDAFYTIPFYIGSTSITIRYFDLFWISFLVLYFCCKKYCQVQPTCKSTVAAMGGITLVQLAFYIYSLGATYLYNFAEHEALAVASYERYNNIAYLAVWVVILVMTLQYIQVHTTEENRNFAIAALTVALFLMSPMRNVSNFLNRDVVRDSFYFRSQYTSTTEQISQFCNESDRVYFISQENDGFDFRVVKYSVYPIHITNKDAWSLGEPYSDRDKWSQNLTAEQWFETLQKDYDYVALHRINDTFIHNYGKLFDDPDSICNGGLYRINAERGLLEKCE